MQTFQAMDDLYEYFPNVILLYVLLIFLVLGDELKKVSVVTVLHNYAIRKVKIIYATYHKLLLASSMNASL